MSVLTDLETAISHARGVLGTNPTHVHVSVAARDELLAAHALHLGDATGGLDMAPRQMVAYGLPVVTVPGLSTAFEVAFLPIETCAHCAPDVWRAVPQPKKQTMIDEEVRDHIRHLVNDALREHMTSVIEAMRRQEAAMVASLTEAVRAEDAKLRAAREPERPCRRSYTLFAELADVNTYCAAHPAARVTSVSSRGAIHSGSVDVPGIGSAPYVERHEGSSAYELVYLVCEDVPCP